MKEKKERHIIAFTENSMYILNNLEKELGGHRSTHVNMCIAMVGVIKKHGLKNITEYLEDANKNTIEEEEKS